MAHDTPQAHAHAEHDHDKNAPKLYTAILAILIMLTFITVSASKIQFGSNMVNVVVALTIATIKASLVALFFMHLLHDKAVNAIILVASFVFLGIFLGTCYTDVFSREEIIPANLKVAPVVAPAAAAPGAPPPAAAEHH